MANSVPLDVMCFDLEIALAKALGKKVETFMVDLSAQQFKFRIGLRWNLVLDADQLEGLWADTDNPSILREHFDKLKPTCLNFQSYERR